MNKVLTLMMLLSFFITFGCDIGSGSEKENPTILSTTPNNTAIDVSTSTRIIITFSEEMEKQITESSFTISPDPGGNKTFSWDGNVMTVDFGNELISHTFYSCEVSRTACNVHNRKMRNAFQWTFVTQQTMGTVGSSDIRIDGAGITPGYVYYFNDIAADGNNVYYTWADSRDGGYDIYFNMSKDGGKTWLPSEVRLNTNAAGASNSNSPNVKCVGDNVYVLWTDDRSGQNDVYMNYSKDGGKTWLNTDFRINKDGAGVSSSSNGNLACVGNYIYVAWYDNRNGATTDIYFNYSADAGETWQNQDKRINTNVVGVSSASDVRLGASGEHVYIEFLDTRNGQTDIYFNCSHDCGVTWMENDIRIDTDVAGSSQNWRPNMACDGGNILVAWTDYRNGGRDIYANFSNDFGETWQVNDVRIDSDNTNAESWWPYLDVCGDSFYIVWNDGRNGDDDIYFNCSHDAGATWLAHDMRLEHDAGPGQFKTFRCEVLATEKTVFAIWQDNRNGWNDIFINYSTDGGYTWQADDFRLDADTPGSSPSERPQMAVTGGKAYVGWMDDRQGKSIYFNYIK